MNGSDRHRVRLAGLSLGALIIVAMAGPAATATAAAPDAKEGAIFERQFYMQQLDDESELLGNIVAGIEPADKLAQTTRAIAKDARASVDSFRATLPGGRSKDEVWSKHDDFMQRMESFARNAELMAKAGETGSIPEVTNLMVDAMPCKQCHDIYRAPKKP